MRSYQDPRYSQRQSGAQTGLWLAIAGLGAGAIALMMCCGCGAFLWWSADRASSQKASRSMLPPDPVLTPLHERGAPPWTPLPAMTDLEPIEPSRLAGLVGYWPLDEGKGTAVAD